MTYTADDFAVARFATHPSGRSTALRAHPHSISPWLTAPEETDALATRLSDARLAEFGWVPVQERAGSYTRTDEEGAPTYWRGVVREYKGALEKAEEERDEAKSWASRWQEEAEGNEARGDALARDLAAAVARADTAEQEYEALKVAYNEQGDALVASYDHPRPLTADDITAELVERYWAAMKNPGSNYDEAVRRALAAALTEPPKRPEGVEEIEGDLIDIIGTGVLNDSEFDTISIKLAERGYRKTGSN